MDRHLIEVFRGHLVGQDGSNYNHKEAFSIGQLAVLCDRLPFAADLKIVSGLDSRSLGLYQVTGRLF